jgi:hypothetical protein
MTDLNENAPFDEVLEGSNTDTLETLTDADIDAINEAMAESEDLENTCETLGENLESDEATSTVAENTTVEPETEPVNNSDRLPDEQFGNSEQLEEPSEPEPQPNPWDDAPTDCYFYERMYEDGHLGSFTESAELAYKSGWDIEHNYILIADTEQSDLNGWTYRKELCPHKSERDKQIELWNREIFELKEELSQTDYKAIKYAEGVLTDEDYQPTGIQRQAWRKRINELERLIAG